MACTPLESLDEPMNGWPGNGPAANP